ncbi:9651_t:CDS:2 [Entrophospora sp. SA101]|nr:1737_t:CDS:2 [Entrophospora sp. SA101]CAJ0751698.1 9651_t:CDS:2 [Entrophospora sp. SA101]
MAVDSSSSRNSPDFKQEEESMQEYDALKDNNSAHDEGYKIKDCVVMRDQNTMRSRGFGFLTFIDPSNVDKVLATDHQLDGKLIDPKRAIPREEQEKTEKIFVGGIAPEVTEEEFKEYFSQFGVVKDATLMVDRDTGRPRGFGFITFESSEPVEVKRAMPKHKSQRVNIYGGAPSVGNAISSGNGPMNGRYGSSYGIGKDGGSAGYSGMGGYNSGSINGRYGSSYGMGGGGKDGGSAGYSGMSGYNSGSINGRYGSPYGMSGGGKDGGGSTGYSGMGGYNSGSYPGSYSAYNNYPNYGYPNSYPDSYHPYNAMTHAYYSSRYGGYNNNYGGGSSGYRGSGSRGGGSGGGAGMNAAGSGEPIYSRHSVRGQHNYHPYAR